MNTLAALILLPYAGLFAWLLVRRTDNRIRGQVAVEAQARHLRQAQRIRKAWLRGSRKAAAKMSNCQGYPLHQNVYGQRQGVEL